VRPGPWAVGLCLAALATTSACGGSDHPAAHASTSPSAGASSSASPSPSPMLTPTAPASTALGAGERVWAAFSERGLSQSAWWAQLKPLLSDSAQATYVYDDPANLPAMSLTGDLHVAAKAPDQARFTAEVVVPTSKGVFALDLERHTIGGRWLLYAINFPPGVD
jgi:hypothetical protein